jgi:hypothetical protein
VARPKATGAGARPLDAGSFHERGEDPNAWYADDSIDEATNFFDRNTLESTENKSGKSDPMELAALLEREDETGRLRVDAEEAKKLRRELVRTTGKNPKVAANHPGLADTEKLPAVSDDAVQAATRAAPRPSGALKYVVIAGVVIAGAGAAAWFAGLIPH